MAGIWPNDVETISPWARNEMIAIWQTYHLIHGIGREGCGFVLYPQGEMSRANAVAVLIRLLRGAEGTRW